MNNLCFILGSGRLCEKVSCCIHWPSKFFEAFSRPENVEAHHKRERTKVCLLFFSKTLQKGKQHIQQLSVTEMRMLHWFCGHTRRNRVWNEDIRDRVGVPPIEEKLIQYRLRWFGHVQGRPPKVPVRSGVLKWVDNVKSGRGQPKLMWRVG